MYESHLVDKRDLSINLSKRENRSINKENLFEKKQNNFFSKFFSINVNFGLFGTGLYQKLF